MASVTPVASPGIPDTFALGIHGRDLSRLANSQDIEQVSKDFEGLFASILLKELQNSLESGSIFGKEASNIYGGLFELFLGQHIGQSGSLGIADMVSRYLEASG